MRCETAFDMGPWEPAEGHWRGGAGRTTLVQQKWAPGAREQLLQVGEDWDLARGPV